MSDFDNATLTENSLTVPNKSNAQVTLRCAGPVSSTTPNLSGSEIVNTSHFGLSGFHANSTNSFDVHYELSSGLTSIIPFESVWIKFNQVDLVAIIGGNTKTANQNIGNFFVENGKFISRTANGATSEITTTEFGECNAGEWYYFTLVASSTKMTSADDKNVAIYLNGKKVASTGSNAIVSSIMILPDAKYDYEFNEVYVADITDDTELRALPDTIQVPKSALII